MSEWLDGIVAKYGKEEEEETLQSTGNQDWLSSITSKYGSGAADYSGYSGGSPVSSMTPFESSIERAKQGYGSFAGEFLPDLVGADNLPSGLVEWGRQAEEEAEKRLSTYRSTYRPDITEEEWQNVLPSIIEKVQENAASIGVPFALAALAPVVAATLPISGATAALTMGTAALLTGGPLGISEVFEEQASIAGIDTSQMTEEQKRTAWITGLQNLALEITPARWLKIAKDIPMPKTPKQLADYIKNADRQTLAKQLKLGAKEVGISSAISGTQETLQSLNIARNTEQGISAKAPGEYITEGIVGAAIGGATGIVPGYSSARSENRLIDKGTESLNALDAATLDQAGQDYTRQFNKLRASFKPASPTTDKLLEDFDIPASELDLFNMPVKDTPPLGFLSKALKKHGYERSSDVFNLDDARRQKAKKLGINDVSSVSLSGKDVAIMRDELFGSFDTVASGSAEGGVKTFFNAQKDINVNDFIPSFSTINRKWQNSFLASGEFFARTPQDIDNYLGAVLENKNIAKFKAVLLKENKISPSKVVEMTKDFKLIKKELKTVRHQLRMSGLDIGIIENYKPIVYDRKFITANREDFIQDLINEVGIKATQASKKDGSAIIRTAEENAVDIYNKFVNGVDPDILSSEQIKAELLAGKGKGKEGFEKRRRDKFDKLPEKYRKQGAFKGLHDYIISTSTRAASVSVFGDRGKKLHKSVNTALARGLIDKAGAKTIWDMYDAEHHLFKRPDTPEGEALQKASKVIGTVGTVAYLGLATISSITEPGWISGRTGLVNTLKATPTIAAGVLKGIRRGIWGGRVGKEAPLSYPRVLINTVGMATDPRVSETLGREFSGDANTFTSSFFRSPGGGFLAQYTNFVKGWTAVAGLKMIQDHADRMPILKGNKLAAWKNELRENGISLKDFRIMHKRFPDGKIDFLNKDVMDSRFTNEKGIEVSVGGMLKPWLRKISTDVALEPRVGNRPLWMSNPNLQLVAQLKSFPILFANTIMRRSMRQINPKVCTPSIVGAVGALGSAATAIALAALALAIKDEIKGLDVDRGPVDYISGVGVPYLDADVSRLASVPSLSVLGDFSKAIVALLGGEPDNLLEEMSDLVTRATVGAIFAEQLDE